MSKLESRVTLSSGKHINSFASSNAAFANLSPFQGLLPFWQKHFSPSKKADPCSLFNKSFIEKFNKKGVDGPTKLHDYFIHMCGINLRTFEYIVLKWKPKAMRTGYSRSAQWKVGSLVT